MNRYWSKIILSETATGWGFFYFQLKRNVQCVDITLSTNITAIIFFFLLSLLLILFCFIISYIEWLQQTVPLRHTYVIVHEVVHIILYGLPCSIADRYSVFGAVSWSRGTALNLHRDQLSKREKNAINLKKHNEPPYAHPRPGVCVQSNPTRWHTSST